MYYGSKPLRIVRTWSTTTQGTAERPFVQTEDGRVWRDTRPGDYNGTGTVNPEIRTERNGYLW